MITSLKIAICDNDLLFGDQARNEVKKLLDKNHVKHSLSMFGAGSELLAAGYFDIIFLDIEMDELSGMETAKRLRLLDYKSHIVFLTSYKKYVFSAFDVSASHYLLKPLDVQKLEQVLIKITTELTTEKEYSCTVKCGNEIHRVPFSKIKFVEVSGRKISLHTKSEVFIFNGRLEELEQSFSSCFFRCHKSFLVNLEMVVKYDKEKATLKSGESVPLARRKFAEFGSAFLTFLRKEGDV